VSWPWLRTAAATRELDALVRDGREWDARLAGVAATHRCGSCGGEAGFDSVQPSGEMVLYVCYACNRRGHQTFVARKGLQELG
jgi:hypothetical protein